MSDLTLTVYLLAFTEEGPIPERPIDIPAADVAEAAGRPDRLRELAFYYGQNDFQPKPYRSVSVGDVVRLPNGTLHRVLGLGWQELPAGTDIGTLERGKAACWIDAKVRGAASS